MNFKYEDMIAVLFRGKRTMDVILDFLALLV